MRTNSTQVAIDLGVLAGVAAAACWWASQLAVMGAVLAAALLLRMVLWQLLVSKQQRVSLAAELAFMALCIVVGGFNDWNTVMRHGVYGYLVPADHPQFSTIPTWMLVYWGLILRGMVTVGAWQALGPVANPTRIRLTPGRELHGLAWRLGALVLLVAITRQCIYRLYLDPLWSWAPFAAGLVVYAWVTVPAAREWRLALLCAVVGPAAEVLLIQVAGLHRYHLGWIGGMPLWIGLWWVLAALIWAEVGSLVLDRLGSLVGARSFGEAPVVHSARVT